MCVRYWVQVSCTHHVALSLTWDGCTSMGTTKCDPTSGSFCMVNSNNFIKLRVYMNRFSIVSNLIIGMWIGAPSPSPDQRTGLVGCFCPCVCVCTFAANVGTFHTFECKCWVGFTEWSKAWKWVDIQMYAHVNSISHLRISPPAASVDRLTLGRFRNYKWDLHGS